MMQARRADARIVRGTVLRYTVSLGRPNGIRVGVHVSWLALFAFVTVTLADGFSDLGTIGAYALAAVGALCLFASVVAHEFGHALAAQRFGVRTSSIVLFLFGGIATLEDEPATPRADAVVALAGPATSLALAAVAGAGLLLIGRLASPAIVEPASLLAAYVALANLALAVFNLMPAFPLDGGRVLRALIWTRTGDRTGATTAASRVGMGFGVLIVAAGVLVCAATHQLAFAWYVLLGAFVLGSGWSNERTQRRRRRIAMSAPLSLTSAA
jgi:Zn-dependent protease